MVCFDLIPCVRNNSNIVNHLIKHHPQDLEIVGFSPYFLAREKSLELEKQMVAIELLRQKFNLRTNVGDAISGSVSGFS